ncbi:4'-phosphopantetheinyl transferase family protein [Teredinibacter purpureus]|uniref:4'-phosphopantetheinyl transferase family protein n=1 Tax=Teredinibacter purpureus TaxID=2731756 RepID=UPI0013C485B7|nr:4'-phosphopantetheinyl transferase superfamily protein [Teredinibacter purpureus]
MTFEDAHYCDTDYATYGLTLPGSLKRAVPKRRAEFLAGRYCARSALITLGYSPVTIGIGDHRQPLWPNGITGSITHKDDIAAAFLCPQSQYVGVGIDIEKLLQPTLLPSIGDQVLTDSERLLTAHACTHQQFVTLIFSVKEAFFKAAFSSVGHYFNFDAVSVIEIDHREHRLQLRLNQTLCNTLNIHDCVTADFFFSSNNTVITRVLLPHTQR